MKEITTQTGAKLQITAAPWEDTLALKAVVMREAAKSGFDFKIRGLTFDSEIDISSLIQAVLLVDSSPEFTKALFKCLARCTYNGEKITMMTFEPVEARENYYPVVIACLEANLLPFFKAPFSELKALIVSFMGPKPAAVETNIQE